MNTQETEQGLDEFRRDLYLYEELILSKAKVVGQLADVDGQLEDLRQRLMTHRASTIFAVCSSHSKFNAKPEASKTVKTSTEAGFPKLHALKSKMHSSTYRHLRAILRILRKEGEAHVSILESQLKMVRSTTMYNVDKGLKLGLLKRVKKGVFAAV
jgi:hypothetical protein